MNQENNMGFQNRIFFIGLLTVITGCFTHCASSYKIQDSIDVNFNEVYSQSWVGGEKDSESGKNLYIHLKQLPNNIVLDSVYFKGQRKILEQVNPLLFLARFERRKNSKPDIIMSNEPYAEYGNKLPRIGTHIPFELKDDECVISYKDGRNRKYFKITGILKKSPIYYPVRPQQKH